jgi:phosphatidate cytidylyltransferase
MEEWGGMFVTRVISAVIFAALFISAALLGKIWFLLFIGLVCTLGILEFASMAEKAGVQIHSRLLIAVALAFLIASYCGIMIGASFALAVIVLICTHLFDRFDNQPGIFARIGITIFGFSYIALPLALFVLLRQYPDGNGFNYVIAALAFTWANDICAYIFGSLFGKHKLAPRISPSKSIEGAVAGVLGTMAVGVLWALIFKAHMVPTILAAAVCALAALVGDLSESLLKRDVGIKDTGNLIPGHGGILDRFDSLFFVVPVFYLILGLTRALI